VLEALGERGLAPLEESHIACKRAGLAEPPRAIGIAYAREVPGGGFSLPYGLFLRIREPAQRRSRSVRTLGAPGSESCAGLDNRVERGQR
jgi:hypothetical protein